jgi:hypothetical protein
MFLLNVGVYLRVHTASQPRTTAPPAKTDFFAVTSVNFVEKSRFCAYFVLVLTIYDSLIRKLRIQMACSKDN